MTAAPDTLARRNARAAGVASTAALAMLALAFASKPLYDTFCRVTGFGGTTQRAEAGAVTLGQRMIEVRFDANIARGLPLTFKALAVSDQVQVGANGLAFFEVTNTSSRPVDAVASYNVTPHKAGPYFVKLECFCFKDTVFQPGETKRLPVVYYVNPDIEDDRGLDEVQTITLSYTYFEAAKAPWLDADSSGVR